MVSTRDLCPRTKAWMRVAALPSRRGNQTTLVFTRDTCPRKAACIAVHAALSFLLSASRALALTRELCPRATAWIFRAATIPLRRARSTLNFKRDLRTRNADCILTAADDCRRCRICDNFTDNPPMNLNRVRAAATLRRWSFLLHECPHIARWRVAAARFFRRLSRLLETTRRATHALTTR